MLRSIALKLIHKPFLIMHIVRSKQLFAVCIIHLTLIFIQDVLNLLKKPVLSIAGDDGFFIVFRKVLYKFTADLHVPVNQE